MLPWPVVTTVITCGLSRQVSGLSTMPGKETSVALAPGHQQGEGGMGQHLAMSGRVACWGRLLPTSPPSLLPGPSP